jgi:hypothetical protein
MPMDEPLGSTIISSKLKAEGSKQKSDPQITQINADYFFKLLAYPRIARVFIGSKQKAGQLLSG